MGGSPLVVLIGIVIIAILTTPLQVIAILRNMVRGSGLPLLARRFAVSRRSTEGMRKHETVRIGTIYFRYVSTVGVSSSGLYISVGFVGKLLKVPPLLIPWKEIRDSIPSKLYGRPAQNLIIGQPEITSITVSKDVYKAMQHYLRMGLSEQVPVAWSA